MTVDRDESTLRIAFLGCGSATRMHSRTLRGFAGVELAYASRDAGRAADFRERFGGVAAFGSYDDALADPSTDVVLVATPPRFHLEQTLAALRAGKHVIVEKPAFLQVADVATVRDAAIAAGRRVLVAENYFYKPLLETLRHLLADGAIGEVRLLYVNAMKEQSTGDWRDDAALAGGGALFEGGIHWINFMANLGLKVRTVDALRPGDGHGLDRDMLVTLGFAEGAAGVLLLSWRAPSPLHGLRVSRIYGTEGAIAFESNGVAVAVHGTRSRLHFPGFRDIAGYRAMFADFLHVLRTGASPRMTLELAEQDLRIAEAAYRAAREHREQPDLPDSGVSSLRSPRIGKSPASG